MSTTSTREQWAAARIKAARGRLLPRYGSPEWLALPDTEPAKVAAVVVAAESWAREADELEERLRRELEAFARAGKRLDDADRLARIEEHRLTWDRLPADANREICRQRREARS